MLSFPFGWLAGHRGWVLPALTLLLPLIPASIAWDMNTHPGNHGDDSKILATWTYLHVATFAYLVFLYWEGPPNYLTAYTATFIGHAFFMQELGRPIGVNLAAWFHRPPGSLGGGWATGAAAYTHHLIVGLLTWAMAFLVVGLTRACAQPTKTKRQETNEEHDRNDCD